MRWIFASLCIGFSALYIYHRFERANAPPAAVPVAPTIFERTEPLSFLSGSDLEKLHKSVNDPDSGIRWTAIVLLYTVKDPESLNILERTIALDPDHQLRERAIQLLRTRSDFSSIRGLIRGLQDTDTNIRLMSLKAIGDIGDPAATPWVTEALKDTEPEVRMAALQTLGRFEDKRKAEFQELIEKLRAQYEEAVKKAARENASR